MSRYRSELADFRRRLNEVDPLILAAAQAIALHNVNREIWNPEEAVAGALTLNHYSIHLTSGTGMPALWRFYSGWLIAFRNGIGRSFELPTEKDKEYTDQDIHLRSKNGRLLLAVAADTEFVDPARSSSAFSCAIQAMKKYLQPDAIDTLVVADTDTLASIREARPPGVEPRKHLDARARRTRLQVVNVAPTVAPAYFQDRTSE